MGFFLLKTGWLVCFSMLKEILFLNLDCQIKQVYVLFAHKVSLLFCMVLCSSGGMQGCYSWVHQSLVPPYSAMTRVIMALSLCVVADINEHTFTYCWPLLCIQFHKHNKLRLYVISHLKWPFKVRFLGQFGWNVFMKCHKLGCRRIGASAAMSLLFLSVAASMVWKIKRKK